MADKPLLPPIYHHSAIFERANQTTQLPRQPSPDLTMSSSDSSSDSPSPVSIQENNHTLPPLRSAIDMDRIDMEHVKREHIIREGAKTERTKMEHSKPIQINSFMMSPPDQELCHDFNQSPQSTPSAPTAANIGAADVQKAPSLVSPPNSPPVDPFIPGRVIEGPTAFNSVAIDPILYPRSQDESLGSPPPLFPPSEITEHDHRLVEDHVARRSPAMFREATPPEKEDYHLILYFKSHAIKRFNEDPRRWLARERRQAIIDRKANPWQPKQRLPALMAKPSPVSTPIKAPVKAPRPVNRQEKVVKSTTATPRPIRANGTPVRQTGRVRVSATPEPRRAAVAPNREDKDFGALEDFCPPLTSLPAKANSLKVDWKGAPINLSGDPNAHLLHPDEITLAANLRLDCATYLTSKRRIFIRRLECARVGKEFRKTDAQQACKIDVNKASKLWTAFEKVGWLHIDWVRRFK